MHAYMPVNTREQVLISTRQGALDQIRVDMQAHVLDAIAHSNVGTCTCQGTGTTACRLAEAKVGRDAVLDAGRHAMTLRAITRVLTEAGEREAMQGEITDHLLCAMRD